ncbi:MAG: transglycosylase SLT domain-containing protein [Synechococcaceae cyanobacterium]
MRHSSCSPVRPRRLLPATALLGLALLMPGCAISSELPSQRLVNRAGRTLATSPPPPALPAQPAPTAGPAQPAPQALAAQPGPPQPPTAAAHGAGAIPAAPTATTRPGGERRYPVLPAGPAALAALLNDLETALRDPDTAEALVPLLAHQQQVLYRVLARQPQLAAQVRQALPARWQPLLDLHLQARRAFLAMHPPRGGVKHVPAWRIRTPAPAETLLRTYNTAAKATGIPWEVLAAINLVESGMGRIDGVSVAGAQGPMQFLPSTWAEAGVGIGGDIHDPRDAIPAAARYLVRRGGLRDIRRALWGYNNSDDYGRGVLAYAELLRRDPAAYRGLYHWQVHLTSSAGDLWLPEGLELRRTVPVEAFLQRYPHTRPAAPGTATNTAASTASQATTSPATASQANTAAPLGVVP